jgi:hypothetical protein
MWRLKDGLPEGWEAEVFSWFSDHGDAAYRRGHYAGRAEAFGGGSSTSEASKNYVQGERGASAPRLAEPGGDAPPAPKLFLDDS